MTTLTAARAEALFTSDLAAGTEPSRAEVRAAINAAVRKHHGVKGCACEVAWEYGDHPDAAAARMCWCLATVTALFAGGTR